MRRVEEHLALCLSAVSALPAEEVGLADAQGRVLAEDVVSPIDLPVFDNSSMDGYAVRAADVAAAAEGAPVRLPVAADIPAGAAEPVTVTPGTVARIMTGAPLPAGADAVVQVEWTDGGTGTMTLDRPVRAGLNIRRAGEDVTAGETVLRAGTRVGARQLALLAAVGRDRVRVGGVPRVVVVSTGSELAQVGQPLRPGQIYDSNSWGLTAAARAAGATARRAGVVRDEAGAVLAAILAAAAEADVVVTSGGVSAGAYDTVKEVLRGLGTVRFDRVAMQPGMPQGFGVVGPDPTPIFTLPGNPVSAMVSFELFVAPALRVLRGEPAAAPGWFRAEAVEGWNSPPAKRQFVRGVTGLRTDPDGHERPTVRPIGGMGSHLVADLALATCLAVVPEDITRVEPGMVLECLPLREGAR